MGRGAYQGKGEEKHVNHPGSEEEWRWGRWSGALSSRREPDLASQLDCSLFFSGALSRLQPTGLASGYEGEPCNVDVLSMDDDDHNFCCYK